MLYRLAIVQTVNNKFLVQKINHARIQDDRKTVAYFLRDHLGPPFDSMEEASEHAVQILDLLVKIERNDALVAQAASSENVRELSILRQSGTAFRQYLDQLTRTSS